MPLLFFARQCCDEIGLPGPAVIVGKGLFHAVKIGGDIRPHESNQDGPPVERFLVEEFSAAVLELADPRLIQNTL